MIHSKYRADIDGLRALAILGVIAFHAFPAKFKSGYTGVDIFFVISGFLISGIIFSSLEKDNFNYIEFYLRRIKRIFPALIIVLLACYVFGWFVLFADEFAQLGKHIGSGAGFISNLMLWSESGYFDTVSESKPLLHLWSLSVEEQFYIVWPFLISITYKRQFGFLSITIFAFLASFLFNLIGVYQQQDTMIFFSPFTRFWELMAGGILAYYNLHKTEFFNRNSNLISLLGFIMVLLGLLVLRKHTAYPGYRALLPVLGACFLIAAGPNAWINRFVLANKFLVSIGLISYPLYLWHWVLLTFLWILEGGALDTLTAATAVIFSFILASITYALIEKPLKNLSINSAVGGFYTKALVVVMILIFGVGFITFVNNGFAHRYANSFASKYDHIDSLVSDPNLPIKTCQEFFGLSEVSDVRCLSNTDQPSYLILGDSHADSLYLGISFLGSSLPAVKIAKNNNLPFISYVSHYARDEVDHYGKPIYVINLAMDLINLKKSISTVVLVTRGNSYFTERNAISKAGLEEKLPKKDAENAFVEGYSELIKRFQSMGKKVILVTEWAELEFPPHSFIQRSINLQSRVHDDSLSISAVNAQQGNYLQLINRIKNQNPSLLVFDSLPVFCNDLFCKAKEGDVIFYRDENHLNQQGSRRLLIEFINWLRTTG